ncbi:hypothetical protein Acr_08g0010150 [Actinidia rufa]|uniref:Uncharacterized protein n=1 Tax=Actinidia rufa TaxID=165716 RepID=A0A7J0F333_9ERIC|nr:hypothetical protein Acr_08g0010150 [Actinidia rufa]
MEEERAMEEGHPPPTYLSSKVNGGAEEEGGGGGHSCGRDLEGGEVGVFGDGGGGNLGGGEVGVFGDGGGGNLGGGEVGVFGDGGGDGVLLLTILESHNELTSEREEESRGGNGCSVGCWVTEEWQWLTVRLKIDRVEGTNGRKWCKVGERLASRHHFSMECITKLSKKLNSSDDTSSCDKGPI